MLWIFLAGVYVVVVGLGVYGRGACVPSVDVRGARTPTVDGDGGVAVVEGDAFAGGDDEGELGEGCEGEELADGGEDGRVDDAGRRHQKASNDEDGRY